MGIMQVEFTRLKRPIEEIIIKPVICTMKKATPILKLPKKNNYGKDPYKWPTLDETYRALVNPDGFGGAHRALNDVVACRQIMLALEPQPADRSKKGKGKNK
jgi:DNA polymerase III epsilon subunit-like protein